MIFKSEVNSCNRMVTQFVRSELSLPLYDVYSCLIYFRYRRDDDVMGPKLVAKSLFYKLVF